MPRCGATTRDENILLENANGVPAPSPGLRACAIPGTNQQKPPNRNAVAAQFRASNAPLGHNRVAVDI